ncbi:Chaperone DnaK [Gossypium australe]|uniref:Chaperone DnaK n=1 Tax=Gossypium australe TaxID=47621 RepID=A0A5B6X173_9ROSI|nr:Chaperone DnaK [Gossypium australe]
MLKARSNLESRIKTLKNERAIIYNMLKGKDNSNFGWDEHSRKEVGQFSHSFPYYDQLISIYVKDRDVATTKNPEEGNNYHRYKYDVSLDEMSIASEMLNKEKLEMLIQENAQKLYLTLYEVEKLTKDECFLTLSKISY